MDREADRAIPRPPQLENRVVGRILDNRRVPSRYDGGKGPSEPRGCSRAPGVRDDRLGWPTPHVVRATIVTVEVTP
jgi:hypothetical protein